MKFILSILIIIIAFCTSCTNNKTPTIIEKHLGTDSTNIKIKNDYDTVHYIKLNFYNNGKIKLELIRNSNLYSYDSSYFIFYKNYNDKWIPIFTDSIFSKNLSCEFKDCNNDKIPDLIINGYTGGRGCNIYEYLYLFDTIVMNLKKVENYNNYPTINFDNINNIFISQACYADKVFYKFLRLNKSEIKLIEMDFGFEDNMFDSDNIQYNQTLKKIILKYGKSIHLQE